MSKPTSTYVNGSDLLLSVMAGKSDKNALGHCTSHTTTYGTETKDRAVKPVATAGFHSSKWKDKSVTGLSISISGEGLRFYDETECSFEDLSGLWGAGLPVYVKAFERQEDANPYIAGYFVITNLEETSPAEDDATYSIQLENAGEPDIYPGKPSGSSDSSD